MELCDYSCHSWFGIPCCSATHLSACICARCVSVYWRGAAILCFAWLWTVGGGMGLVAFGDRDWCGARVVGIITDRSFTTGPILSNYGFTCSYFGDRHCEQSVGAGTPGVAFVCFQVQVSPPGDGGIGQNERGRGTPKGLWLADARSLTSSLAIKCFPLDVGSESWDCLANSFGMMADVRVVVSLRWPRDLLYVSTFFGFLRSLDLCWMSYCYPQWLPRPGAPGTKRSGRGCKGIHSQGPAFVEIQTFSFSKHSFVLRGGPGSTGLGSSPRSLVDERSEHWINPYRDPSDLLGHRSHLNSKPPSGGSEFKRSEHASNTDGSMHAARFQPHRCHIDIGTSAVAVLAAWRLDLQLEVHFNLCCGDILSEYFSPSRPPGTPIWLRAARGLQYRDLPLWGVERRLQTSYASLVAEVPHMLSS